MSLQENKDIVRHVVDLINQGKLEQVKELYTSDFSNHDPSAPTVRDREALMQNFAARRAAFPNAQITTEDLIAEGDQVAERWTYHGTHNGAFMGIPATGKEISITGITIYRIAGGKVAEWWSNYDSLGMMRQIGVIPPLGQRGE
jgi:steroid delta-isomerase-like uncharacterized protein